MSNLYSKKIFIYITVLVSILLSVKSFTTKDAANCFKVNQYNSVQNSKKEIGDMQKCFKTSKQCCFINITHYYGDYKLTQEYCNYLNVNITQFKEFLFNMYNDDEMFYANFSAYNYEMYQIIGRNLEKPLTETLNCFIGPQSAKEYSTYADKNCKEFKDGICLGAKNNTMMNAFVTKYHSDYAADYCNKKEDENKCIKYSGAHANDKMVLPLLKELRDYLQADSDEYVVVNNESNVDINPDTDEDDGTSSFLGNWTVNGRLIKKCKDRPNVTVDIQCPPGYKKANYVNINFIYYIFVMFLILF